MIQLLQGDCIELMKTLPDKSIDAIITDPPYGTTACKWDSVIPFTPMWEQLKRVIKHNGAIVLFGSEPFSSLLRCSNLQDYRYDWIWEKNLSSNFAAAKMVPMKEHENISVFYQKKCTYNEQRIEKTASGKSRAKSTDKPFVLRKDNVYKTFGFIDKQKEHYRHPTTRHPRSIIKFNCERGLHPTQKPVALLEYLIKTYTNEGETVLDFTAGSGTTGVSAINTNRNAILIERDTEYCDIIKKRITEAEQNKANRLFVGE